ncbi:diphosphomevalonate decarboxylase [Gillisia sp. Hel_I_86]|uniref:diphosphomevalonate/mevalonate 3,5-bisphosphate decarboxylase family protein n=1 Tax=Gillisia sp. Hel_I_86 TaxID=1249981 RepID=UPI00119940BC|nr:diphosphomevalonate decarboxylase [Gillisia sp. Hel_I_86]TVZ26668.1 diphosphomevalonate decarboxylase [Gillisia sp. Hel_I_86]
MQAQDFIPQSKLGTIDTGKVAWQSPSNIALVKYWGKKENQIPANPSISFTLNNCKTTTSLECTRKKDSENKGDFFDFEFYFEGKKKEDFKPKIYTFFERIEKYCPYLKEYKFTIHSKNSFPHSSGIASSASGMSALALSIVSIEKELNPTMSDAHFYRKASFLARLGSGSACRSIQGKLVVWGEHAEIEGSSNLYGVEYPNEVHQVFENYQDTILLVDKGEKKVSSSVGHDLMHNHPFAEERFKQAHRNLTALRAIFSSGNLNEFIEIVENEALTLHAMMMSSNPYFILMKPNTLEIINKIWAFREATGLPICFTLDAGANVHVLYPEKNKIEIFQFIENELLTYCDKNQFISDSVGFGSIRL